MPNFTILLLSEYKSVGCWKDENQRALPSLEGTSSQLDGHYKTRVDSIEKCSFAALENGFDVFAVQDGGACFGGCLTESRFCTVRYKQYGTSDKCISMKGGPMANDVYEWGEFYIELTKIYNNMKKQYSNL